MPKCGQQFGGGCVLLPESFAGSRLALRWSPMVSSAIAQVSHPEQVQIKPPFLRITDPPSPDATAVDLEKRGDELRVQKLYLDALDYYHAALAKAPKSATVLNKIGITELMMQRYREARKSFEQSIKVDHKLADAYNNLGVVYYELKKYGAAVKEYRRAIAIDSDFGIVLQQYGRGAIFQERVRSSGARLRARGRNRSRCF